jgi:Trypsin-co-occurring domain 1
MSAQVVTYRLDESTLVGFEIEPTDGFAPAGPDQIAGWVRDAVGPAVDVAKVVLDRIKEAGPNRVELRFGVKVSGAANWLVARGAAEGNFEVTLSWEPGTRGKREPGTTGT